jgi:glycosyltransferase involved in cell wall biosynthesis
MSQPKFSIITVSLNSKDTIEATIQSVLNQKFTNYEYLIIDGGSKDGTLDILEKYQTQGALTYLSEPDAGIYYAMNKGVKQSKGDWIYFLGSDDIFFDESVLHDVYINVKSSIVEVIYGNVKFLHSGVTYDGFFDHEKISTKNICHQALFVNKTVYDKIGLFNTEYKMSADFEFNLRWMGLNIPSLYLNRTIAIYNELGLSGKIWDKVFYYDFNNLLIKNNIVSRRSFLELKRRHEGLLNSYGYKICNKLLKPFSWLRIKLKK